MSKTMSKFDEIAVDVFGLQFSQLNNREQELVKQIVKDLIKASYVTD